MRPVVFVLALAGCGRLGFDDSASYRFTDAQQAEFDLGSYDAGSVPLSFREGLVRFADDGPYARTDVGIYVSRVFDTRDAGASWRTLAWAGPAPQGRGLSDNEGADDGYDDRALPMAGNILLLHFDGDGDTADGDLVPDTSGRLHDGDIVFAGQGARYTRGVIGSALDIDRDAWVHLDGNNFDYGTDDFTYAVWTKMFACSQSNDNRIALGGAGAGDTPHMWIGASCPDACPGGDGAFMNFLDTTRAGTSLASCTGVVLDDGTWHHLAGVKRGHAPATLTLYVDGREVATTMFDYGAATFTYDAGELRLGGFNLDGAQYNTRIVVDEAAIWKRALEPTEVEAAYTRGAVHLELQVRACADGTCDTEPFVGPDGTTATYFTEADLTGAPGTQQDNLAALGLTGALAQYRVRFSTAAGAISPELARVTLEAIPRR